MSFVSPVASSKARVGEDRPEDKNESDQQKFKKESPPKLRIIRATDGEPIPELELDWKKNAKQEPDPEETHDDPPVEDAAPPEIAGSLEEAGTATVPRSEPGLGVAQSLLQIFQLLGGEGGIFRKWAGLKTYHDVGAGKKGGKFKKGAMIDDHAG